MMTRQSGPIIVPGSFPITAATWTTVPPITTITPTTVIIARVSFLCHVLHREFTTIQQLAMHSVVGFLCIVDIFKFDESKRFLDFAATQAAKDLKCILQFLLTSVTRVEAGNKQRCIGFS
jgi:hypothetical protein